MNKLKKYSLLSILAIGLLSFKLADLELIEFSYPKRENTTISINIDEFKLFTKEWRGSDYYYSAGSKNGIVCSVLYYKLTDEEQSTLVDIPRGIIDGPELSPAYPFVYFSKHSNLNEYEKNEVNWGNPTDDFMFRQNDVPEINGVKIKQKHMYGYLMPDKDLFVTVHLSKADYTPEDSTAMRQILNSLKRKK
ncbi:MAG: hypothetical protein ACO1N0_09725 [Fluviicola sp.]